MKIKISEIFISMFYDKKKRRICSKRQKNCFLAEIDRDVIMFWYQKSVDCIMQKMSASMEKSCIICMERMHMSFIMPGRLRAWLVVHHHVYRL